MPHRLDTAENNGIHNEQGRGNLTYGQLCYIEDLCKAHADAIPRTQNSIFYNCHGLTFACRRTKITQSRCLELILKDDRYREISDSMEVKPGDTVLYYSDDGDPNHSGVVLEAIHSIVLNPNEPTTHKFVILSKWGNAPEFIHDLKDVPPEYGPHVKFFRCSL